MIVKACLKAAADWLILFQDDEGGWKTNVIRTVTKEIKTEAGWYNAMAQGQAVSLLCRMFQFTKKKRYLNAALKAVKIFDLPADRNGIVAMLFGIFPWYEEYPTAPPLFVLNGFMYSLFGLYDLWKTASKVEGRNAKRLFIQGVKTLESALPLFDNGFGTFYDLRHISLPGTSPNRARWQYHRVHLEQLYAIVSITNSKSINETLKRWIDYTSGILSRHN